MTKEELYKYGSEVFKDKETFEKWLNSPYHFWYGLKPIERLQKEGGIQDVYDILGRIEYGVYGLYQKFDE